MSVFNTLVSRAKAAKFTENVIYIIFSALGFDDELMEYAEDNRIILVDGEIMISNDDPPVIF